MDIINIHVNDINLDNDFNEDNPDTIILVRLLVWYIKFENAKHLKQRQTNN